MARAAIACLVLAACGGDRLSSRELPACGQWSGGHWDERFVSPGATGFDAHVTALVQRPDGSVVAAGSFEGMSGVTARSIAVWNGATWAPLGTGLPGRVSSVAFDDEGTLWAVGNASTPIAFRGEDGLFGAYLARWDGAVWTYIIEGADSIEGVAAIDGGIAIYGSFQSAGPALFSPVVALWRHGTWQSPELFGGFVNDVVRTEQGLCAVGSFDSQNGPHRAACWNGTRWTELGVTAGGGPLPSPQVLARAPDGTWFAGGALSLAGDDAEARYGILRLDETGTWRPFAGGVHMPDEFVGGTPRVQAIAFDGDAVIIGGEFGKVGGTTEVPTTLSYDLARWEPGAGWVAMTGNQDEILEGTLATMLVANGRTFLGGTFRRVGEASSPGIAVVEADQTKHALPDTAGNVLLGRGEDLIATPSGIIAAGDFTTGWLAQFDGELRALTAAPVSTDQRMELAALPNGELAALVHGSGANNQILWSRQGQWYQIVDELVAGSIVVDGDGALYFVVPGSRRVAGDEEIPLEIPVSTIIRATSEDVGVYARTDGIVTRLAVHDGALLAVIDLPGEGDAVLQYRDETWATIGAFDRTITGIASSPALGLVVTNQRGAKAWDGAVWTTLAEDPVVALEACSDGLAGVIGDELGTYRLAFLGGEEGWQRLSGPTADPVWHLAPAEGGIYALHGGGFSDAGPAGLSRWTTRDDTGW